MSLPPGFKNTTPKNYRYNFNDSTEKEISTFGRLALASVVLLALICITYF